MRWLTIYFRSCRLRCPRCGQDRLFRGWFTMNTECGHCGLKYERGPGFFLGSIYVNYGLTALLLVAVLIPAQILQLAPPRVLLFSGVAFSLLFPLWFFRYARSLWLGFDQYWDPPQDDEPPQESAADDDEADEEESWRASL